MGAMGAIHKNASVAAQPRRRADLVSGSKAAHPRNGALRHTSLGRITMKPCVRIAGSRRAPTNHVASCNSITVGILDNDGGCESAGAENHLIPLQIFVRGTNLAQSQEPPVRRSWLHA